MRTVFIALAAFGLGVLAMWMFLGRSDPLGDSSKELQTAGNKNSLVLIPTEESDLSKADLVEDNSFSQHHSAVTEDIDLGIPNIPPESTREAYGALKAYESTMKKGIERSAFSHVVSTFEGFEMMEGNMASTPSPESVFISNMFYGDWWALSGSVARGWDKLFEIRFGSKLDKESLRLLEEVIVYYSKEVNREFDALEKLYGGGGDSKNRTTQQWDELFEERYLVAETYFDSFTKDLRRALLREEYQNIRKLLINCNLKVQD